MNVEVAHGDVCVRIAVVIDLAENRGSELVGGDCDAVRLVVEGCHRKATQRGAGCVERAAEHIDVHKRRMPRNREAVQLGEVERIRAEAIAADHVYAVHIQSVCSNENESHAANWIHCIADNVHVVNETVGVVTAPNKYTNIWAEFAEIFREFNVHILNFNRCRA